VEISIIAHDPLNEGFGFVLAVSFDGKEAVKHELSKDEAYHLMGVILRSLHTATKR